MIHPDSLIVGLRNQPFYRGQILRVRHLEGRPPQSCGVEEFFERIPHLKKGSLSLLFQAYGLDDIHTSILAGFRRAFPESSEEPCDAILVESRNLNRELFWQLTCMVAALDHGQVCLVLCHNAERVDAVIAKLQQTIKRADIEYALPVAGLKDKQDFSCFDSNAPLLIALCPETLRDLLRARFNASIKETVLSALGRVVLPDMEEWPPALVSHTAYLLRELHVECARRGVWPSVLGSSAPVLNLEEYARELWGKPIEDECFLRSKAVETAPITFINYSGALVSKPGVNAELVREPIADVAINLLKYLVGDVERANFTGIELHYLLDKSGSMAGRLPKVAAAVIADLKLKLDSKTLKPGDRVRLTVFEEGATQVFDQQVPDKPEQVQEFLNQFSTVIQEQQAGGGTNIPVALGSALKQALRGDAKAIEIILFSDGESPVAPSHRSHVIRRSRELRAKGKALGILYVVLDMEPPANVVNLIREMGGRTRQESTDNLTAAEGFQTDVTGEDVERETIVFLAGENGLPGRIVQDVQGGKRKLIYTRDISKLTVDPRYIGAVVVSGRYASIDHIMSQVAHLGRGSLPVFILTEPEASGQMLTEDYPETAELMMSPLIWTRNENVRRLRLTECTGSNQLPAEIFRYLTQGVGAYPTLLRYFGVRTVDEPEDLENRLKSNDLPVGFEIEECEGKQFVHREETTRQAEDDLPLRTWTDDRIRVEGSNISAIRDRANAPLLFYPGAVVDHGDFSAEVEKVAKDEIKLRPRSADRLVPLLENIVLKEVDAEAWQKTTIEVADLGIVQWGAVHFKARITGQRTYPASNLDDRVNDNKWAENAQEVEYHTLALRWKPVDADDAVRVGLANLVRLGLPCIFRYADQTLFVYPDAEKSIWLVDMAVGGNGASHILYRNRQVLTRILALSGRVLLECPCEGGLAGASTDAKPSIHDTGCPRCMRVIGPVLVAAASTATVEDRLAGVSKKQTLEWLLAHGHLAKSAAVHLKEKYEGVDDESRVVGADDGSRRALFGLVRRILSDRLGLIIEEEDVASFDWLKPDGNMLGMYEPKENRLKILRGMVEWLTMDVCVHELFHNYQCRLPELFKHEALGESANPKPAFGGKLFIEGSAMWAESHVVDALAIRTSLELNHLRQGDEYGEGFKLFKTIEEKYGGVSAVLAFLQIGDISTATAGKISSLDHLYQVVGVRHKLRD